MGELAPDGIDVYFDNVGGDILDAALANLRRGARVVICGAISSYNDEKPGPGPSRYMSLLVVRASMTGFVVFDYADRYGEAVAKISQWLAEGKIKASEHVVEGGVARFGENTEHAVHRCEYRKTGAGCVSRVNRTSRTCAESYFYRRVLGTQRRELVTAYRCATTRCRGFGHGCMFTAGRERFHHHL